MKEISLTQGKVALVDDSDYEYLNQWKWCASKARRTYYAFRRMEKDGKITVGTMHQFLMNQSKGLQVDHIDDNGLNNQRGNLRVCTNQENHMKTQIQRTAKGNKKSSNYKGVSSIAGAGKWRARIHLNGNEKYLGRFSSERDAAVAYNDAANKLFGEYARLNNIHVE
jgi:hypothetical protein